MGITKTKRVISVLVIIVILVVVLRVFFDIDILRIFAIGIIDR